MQVPLQVAFRNMDRDPMIEAEIARKAEKLEEFSNHITSCTVTVEAPHRHHQQGNLYRVRIHLSIPEHHEIVVDRQDGDRHAHEDVYVAIRDAFKAARRQLQDVVREMRGATKQHTPPAHGRITKLFPLEGYGFVATPDGREVYFHANSLVDEPFEKLEIGDEVRFVEEPGESGPQATTVHLLGESRHIVP
jgi:cold shock CspA family protein/ribosome-associated translation inhibitor RaiA